MTESYPLTADYCEWAARPTGFTTSVKWNSHLPPVGPWLWIRTQADILLAKRESWVTDKNAEPTYLLADGREIKGRFEWTIY